MKLVAALRQFWEARTGRERLVLAAAGIIVLSAGLYGLLWEPGLKAAARLSATLPRLRAQVEDMRQQQKEIIVLRKQSTRAIEAADLRALLRASIARSSLGAAAHSLEPQPNERVLLAAPAFDFDTWLQWVAAAQRELGIRLEACNVTALEEPGRVRIEASFVSGGGGR